MLPKIELDAGSAIPLYRQLYDKVKLAIQSEALAPGQKLPATRELAGLLGLNRTTVSAAYELLESEGLVRGHVGRGSFVMGPPEAIATRLNWDELIPPDASALGAAVALSDVEISFAASRPSELLFPLEEFRATCREVIASDEAASILQLGSTAGYAPLRRRLLGEARRLGVAGPDDDILITNGCQQAFDLIQRVLAAHGETVVIEDPVYPGLKNVFLRGGARVVGAPVGPEGIDVDHLRRLFEKVRPRLVVVTPNFQNPTGVTLPPAARTALLGLARQAGVVIVENDLYGELRYEGEAAPNLKGLDESGDTILLGSFSKVAFPGLRVGWAIGPRHFIARLTEAKQWSDIHTDQLSQAVLLRFAESGRLEAHRKKMLAAGGERLRATLEACGRELPKGSRFTRPQGGMNVWVRLPESLDAGELLARAQRENVNYLPGRYFAVSRVEPNSLRLSFAGLEPRQIRAGIATLGQVFSSELERVRATWRADPAPALV